MISEPQYRIQAFSYLVAYNLFFILPLVAVFFSAAYGLNFVKAGQRRSFLLFSKLGHVMVFVFMAGVIAYNLGWL